MNPSIEFALLILSMFLSGFFSGSEAALLSLPREKAKQMYDNGGVIGKAMKLWVEKPNDILTTILVGNNFVNIFMASLSTAITQRYFENDALAITVGVVTISILIFGEIIPKTLARNHTETLSPILMLFLVGLYYGLYPINKTFILIIRLVLGKNANVQGRQVTTGDIESMVEIAEAKKSIDSKQLDLLSSILEFPSIKVRDIMVPRSNIEAIKSESDFKEIIDLVRDVAHSRYPVYEEDLDEVLGFLHVKDLAFVTPKDQESFQVLNYIKPPFFVYEHMKIQAVFDYMNRKKVHLALVKDENGTIVGMLTLEDIMEEIFGEIQDEHDDDQDIIRGVESAEGITVQASISLRDLNSEYDIKINPSDNYSTLNGFILENLGNNFPKKGNLIIWEGYSFEILDVDNDEILDVKIKSTSGDQPQSDNNEEKADETVGVK